MARIPRFLRTQTGLRVALGVAAVAVWGVTWASTLSGGSGPVAAASAARSSPSPTAAAAAPAVGAAALSPSAPPLTPTPAPTPTRRPRPAPTRSSTPPAPPPTPTPSPVSCTVTYRLSSSGPRAFVAVVAIANTGSTAINGWTLAFTFSGNQTISTTWNAVVTQTGAAVSARNTTANPSVPAGGTTGFGFQATYSGTNASPRSFTLNGHACTAA